MLVSVVLGSPSSIEVKAEESGSRSTDSYSVLKEASQLLAET